ncbi:type III-A CRISPR-associated protein Cas10/Csm1 [Anaerohalosphaeraceae bacterium U12dextr]
MAIEKDMIEMAIGTLFHDIGKIYERTGIQLPQQNTHLFKYSHAAYTGQFFNEIGNLWKHLDNCRIANLASKHHNPSTPEEILVQQADIYSAASERQDKGEQFIKTGKSSRPLISIFNEIRLNSHISENPLWAYPVERWKTSSDAIFPQQYGKCDIPVNPQQYIQLYDNFKMDIINSVHCPRHLLVDHIIGLCRTYMSLITSSATRDELPDIPLFDHSYTTAAITCAMYAWYKEKGTLSSLTHYEQNQDIQNMLMVCGDVSGIQDFILDLPNEAQAGTAKMLRARSFYISMLTRAAVFILLERLGLPSCNCIKDAGGQFTLLIQNTNKAKIILGEVRKQFEDWMLGTFGGKLALNLSEPVAVSGRDFKDGNYHECLEEMALQIDKTKKRRFACSMQNQQGWDISAAIQPVIDPEKNPLCQAMIDLGGKLTSTHYILLERTDRDKDPMTLFGQLKLITKTDIPTLTDTTLAALSINPRHEQSGFAGKHLAHSVPRLTEAEAGRLNNEDPEGDWQCGQVKPFEMIAESASGAKLLAVLKGDVDYLGKIFSRGLMDLTGQKAGGKYRKYSISRLSALSRMMDNFFSGYLEHLISSQYQEVYTEYAGGDDLLLIGPWDQMMELALKIHKQFSAYTCHNLDIHLSAAIVLCHPRTPISDAIRQAEELLDNAKKSGRNRIGIFGLTLPWPDYEKALHNGTILAEWVSSGIITGSLNYRLLKYYHMFRRVSDKKNHKIPIEDIAWKSQLRYDLARNVEKDKTTSVIRNKLVEMTSDEVMPRMKVSTIYALYKNRK